MATPPFKVKAVFDYSSAHEDDLKFHNGQIIIVTEVEDADWYIGEYLDNAGVKQTGLFPSNFVERFEPEAPPRPARSKVKRAPETEPRTQAIEVASVGVDDPPATPDPVKVAPQPAREEPPSAAATSTHADKHAEPQFELPKVAPVKSVQPPATAEKPSSFKDRIAAFNKSSAPPIVPIKPGGIPSSTSGFIKKPFVAPPPARNSYLPLPAEKAPIQKVYRREEDPEILERQAQDQEDAARAGFTTSESHPADELERSEDGVKPTSLKDRIALLQKQQQEQAARRADLAQKEKPRPPQHQPTEPINHNEGNAEEFGIGPARTHSPESMGRPSTEQPREVPRQATGNRTSRDYQKPPDPVTRESLGSGNATEQLVTDRTEEAGDAEMSEKRASREKRVSMPPASVPPAALAIPSSASGEQIHLNEREDNEGEDAIQEGLDEEEEEIDAETRRKIELRERMAKMSGGMGMAGMFGPPAGLSMPGGAPKRKQSTGTSEPRQSAHRSDAAPPPPQTQRNPTVSVAGNPRIQSPYDENKQLQEEQESESNISNKAQHVHAEMLDGEDVRPQSPVMQSSARTPAPTVPQDRPLPSAQASAQTGQPRAVNERQLPAPPESRAVPPPPVRSPRPHSTSQRLDEETFIESARTSSHVTRDLDMPGRSATMPIPGTPGVPRRPEGPRSPPSSGSKRMSYMEPPSPGLSSSLSISEKRASRLPPPIPTGYPNIPNPSESRARPPPPPPTAPNTRPSTQQSSVEFHQYAANGAPDNEGDYGASITSSAGVHKAAETHLRKASQDEGILSESDSTSWPTAAAPSLPPSIQRQIPPPPPPPHQAPRSRQSMDAPRMPPPVPPSREHESRPNDNSYDPYRYRGSDLVPPDGSIAEAGSESPTLDNDPTSSSPYPPQRRSEEPPPLWPSEAAFQDRFVPPLPSQQYREEQHDPAASRQSRDIAQEQPPEGIRSSMSISRRSIDHSQFPNNQGQIARNIDLGGSSQWWARPKALPPSLEARSDILYEMEESTTSKRGGRTQVSKDVYVLFQDYSQTVITVHFDSKDPADVHLEQRHEPPPARVSQEALEEAHRRFGAEIATAVVAQQNRTVGDGSPHNLVSELVKHIPRALQPVGTRSYGALVYANMANATIMQYDEIRPGDIIAFRNTKFQGKHGTMHAKYTAEVGKPEHVAIVVDWDGTKKKVRAWEQGRDGNRKEKVREESFRIGDLRSGEIKVWRVMGREWVGWEGD